MERTASVKRKSLLSRISRSACRRGYFFIRCSTASPPDLRPIQYGVRNITAVPARLTASAVGSGKRTPLAAYKTPEYSTTETLLTAKRATITPAASQELRGV